MTSCMTALICWLLNTMIWMSFHRTFSSLGYFSLLYITLTVLLTENILTSFFHFSLLGILHFCVIFFNPVRRNFAWLYCTNYTFTTERILQNFVVFFSQHLQKVGKKVRTLSTAVSVTNITSTKFRTSMWMTMGYKVGAQLACYKIIIIGNLTIRLLIDPQCCCYVQSL